MSTKTFLPLHVGNLTANNVYSLCKSTIDLANPLKSYLGDTIRMALKQLAVSTEKFQHELNKSFHNEFAGKLVAADKVRKECFSEIRKVIARQVKGSDERKKATAQNLDFFFTPYWFPVNETMDIQTDDFFDMFARYHRSNSLLVSAKIVGVDLLLNELEILNDTYDALYKLQIFQEAALPDLSLSEQRSELCNNYLRFCDIIEQTVNFLPNDIIIRLFNKMGELRQKYFAILSENIDEPIVVTVNKLEY